MYRRRSRLAVLALAGASASGCSNPVSMASRDGFERCRAGRQLDPVTRAEIERAGRHTIDVFASGDLDAFAALFAPGGRALSSAERATLADLVRFAREDPVLEAVQVFHVRPSSTSKTTEWVRCGDTSHIGETGTRILVGSRAVERGYVRARLAAGDGASLVSMRLVDLDGTWCLEDFHVAPASWSGMDGTDWLERLDGNAEATAVDRWLGLIIAASLGGGPTWYQFDRGSARREQLERARVSSLGEAARAGWRLDDAPIVIERFDLAIGIDADPETRPALVPVVTYRRMLGGDIETDRGAARQIAVQLRARAPLLAPFFEEVRARRLRPSGSAVVSDLTVAL